MGQRLERRHSTSRSAAARVWRAPRVPRAENRPGAARRRCRAEGGSTERRTRTSPNRPGTASGVNCSEKQPTRSTTSVNPKRRRLLMRCAMNGAPFTGSKGFGTARVSSPRRVPRPPARMTACSVTATFSPQALPYTELRSIRKPLTSSSIPASMPTFGR